jgi:hypothetical protein
VVDGTVVVTTAAVGTASMIVASAERAIGRSGREKAAVHAPMITTAARTPSAMNGPVPRPPS